MIAKSAAHGRGSMNDIVHEAGEELLAPPKAEPKPRPAPAASDQAPAAAMRVRDRSLSGKTFQRRSSPRQPWRCRCDVARAARNSGETHSCLSSRRFDSKSRREGARACVALMFFTGFRELRSGHRFWPNEANPPIQNEIKRLDHQAPHRRLRPGNISGRVDLLMVQ
jgi:hypothetical protein